MLEARRVRQAQGVPVSLRWWRHLAAHRRQAGASVRDELTVRRQKKCAESQAGHVFFNGICQKCALTVKVKERT